MKNTYLTFVAEMNNSSSVLKCFQEIGNVVINEIFYFVEIFPISIIIFPFNAQKKKKITEKIYTQY